MRKDLLTQLAMLLITATTSGQNWTGNSIVFNDAAWGNNSDYTALYRSDTAGDQARLRLQLGDDNAGFLEVGYIPWQPEYNNQWRSLVTFDLSGTIQFTRSSLEKKKIDFGAYSYLESRNVNGDAMSANSYATSLLRNAFVNDHASNTYLNPNGYLQSQRIEMRAGNWYFDYRAGQSGSSGVWPESEWQNKFYIDGNSGNIGVGTIAPGSFKLAVNGKIWSQEVNVAMTNPGPDYVFEPDYDLLSLSELETYITQNKHLPEVPSAREMEKEGLNLKEMNLLLLKKVEELTLHLIEQEKKLSVIDELKKELKEIKAQLK